MSKLNSMSYIPSQLVSELNKKNENFNKQNTHSQPMHFFYKMLQSNEHVRFCPSFVGSYVTESEGTDVDIVLRIKKVT